MKLRTKMIVAFTTVVLIMGIFQYLYFQQRISSQFQQFLDNQQLGVMTRLEMYFEDYYKLNGSFANIEDILKSNVMMQGMGRRHVGMQTQGMPLLYNLQLVIADHNGEIIADSQDIYNGKLANQISGTHRDLIVDGRKIGELIVIRGQDIMIQNLASQFMKSTNFTILLGTLIGSIIAVLLGGFFARELTSPLTKLMEGIKRLSSGDTTFRVQLSKKDEFFLLAKAFNQMSEQLSHNEKLRQKLMADVAHELRTPLTVIRGKLESIQEGVIEANEKEIMLLVDDVYRLSRLVNDLQQLSLAEAGKLPLHKQPINIYQFLQKIVANFSVLAEEKNISLTIHTTSEDIIISIDEDRMTQVIVNFLDNALRHTPNNGQIIIKLTNDHFSNRTLITISDTGPGIEPELLPYIFERFSRTDESRSRDHGGAGLGLSIAKGFVEAHHGTISVHSEKGKGTSFQIELPKGDNRTYNIS
ncbi:sensor histidine kinase [Calidifontibacillus oryziterrae]|uniref:sensor histidine kinase n=1 Tax=Calidifontibacillus oryziterrae TaxID=1191699 RepID=UPI000304CA5A|nr:ATP-binding protein [Calidifontibacillus oryziterrae]